MIIFKEEKLELHENKKNTNSHSLMRLRHYDFIIVILFLVLITLKYPLIFIKPFPSGTLATSLYTSDLISLSLFSMFMIFFKYKDFILFINSSGKIFKFLLLLFFIIVIIQFFTFNNYSLKEFSFSLSWVIIPLSVYLYFDTFKKFIVPYFSFMWYFNFIHTSWQLYNSFECVGIPANRNWHGCFLIITTPFIIYSIYNFLKRKNISNRVIILSQSPIITFTVFALYKAESRGANLSLIIAIILFSSLTLIHSKNLFINKYKKIFFCLTIILTIFSAITIPLFFGNKLANTISQDIRIPMWEGAIDLFINHPELGIGSPNYEASYAYYKPIGYFLRSHYFASRSTHPHNQLLYYAGSYGFFGLLTLSLLWLYPILYFFKQYDLLSIKEKIIFFTLVMISFHSLLDTVIMQWPTMQLFFILQGIAWGYVFKYKKNEPALYNHKSANSLTILCYILGIFFFISTIYIIYANTKRSLYNRNYLAATSRTLYASSIINKQKAIDSNNEAIDIFDAGIQSLLIFNDYRLTYHYFLKLKKHPMRIIANTNFNIANCLIKMNRKSEALQYLKEESTLFPLASLPLYKQIFLERELGKTNDAEKTAFKLIQQLKFKGLQLSDMKKILANPELDNKFHLINNSKLNK